MNESVPVMRTGACLRRDGSEITSSRVIEVRPESVTLYRRRKWSRWRLSTLTTPPILGPVRRSPPLMTLPDTIGIAADEIDQRPMSLETERDLIETGARPCPVHEDEWIVCSPRAYRRLSTRTHP